MDVESGLEFFSLMLFIALVTLVKSTFAKLISSLLLKSSPHAITPKCEDYLKWRCEDYWTLSDAGRPSAEYYWTLASGYFPTTILRVDLRRSWNSVGCNVSMSLVPRWRRIFLHLVYPCSVKFRVASEELGNALWQSELETV